MAKYRQTYENSCGAAALLCAATELGITQIPRAGRWSFLEASTPLVGNTGEVSQALLGWRGDYFVNGLVEGGQRVEAALYAVTSGDLKGYSVPSRVAGCARQLGLTIRIYLGPGPASAALLLAYPNERAACADQGVAIHETASPGATEKERELVVLQVGLGLHYVMRRPPNCGFDTYMDPANGKDYTDFDALKGNGKYVDTGVSLMVSN